MAKLRFKPVSIGLQVRVKIPPIHIPVLETLDSESVTRLVSEALRSAGRPAVTALKSLLKAELIKSDQSTGATERAVTMKYGKSKTKERTYYLLVGISKLVEEIHTAKVPDGYTTRLNRGRGQRGRGLFGLRTKFSKRGRNGKIKSVSKQVFSRYRNDYRITRLAGKAFKRIPAKYFHLIDRGFDHYRAGPVPGYSFIVKLQNSLGNTIQEVFNRRMKELVIPIIKQELIRKFRSVLK